MRPSTAIPSLVRVVARLALVALTTVAMGACGAEPATPDAGRVCDPGWTCPDCQNYARVPDGGCVRLDPNACGPNRQRCGAGQLCATVVLREFDPDSGENVQRFVIRCESIDP